MPHYKECASLVAGLGYVLVELRVVPQKGSTHVLAVVTSKDSTKSMGVNDCAKVHRLLLPRLEVLLNSEDIYMEVTSPGMERNIKNAAEFPLFIGKEVRVWSKQISEWLGGVIVNADDKSVSLDVSKVENNKKVLDNFDNTAVAADSERQGDIMTVLYEDIAKAKFIHL